MLCVIETCSNISIAIYNPRNKTLNWNRWVIWVCVCASMLTDALFIFDNLLAVVAVCVCVFFFCVKRRDLLLLKSVHLYNLQYKSSDRMAPERHSPCMQTRTLQWHSTTQQHSTTNDNNNSKNISIKHTHTYENRTKRVVGCWEKVNMLWHTWLYIRAQQKKIEHAQSYIVNMMNSMSFLSTFKIINVYLSLSRVSLVHERDFQTISITTKNRKLTFSENRRGCQWNRIHIWKWSLFAYFARSSAAQEQTFH